MLLVSICVLFLRLYTLYSALDVLFISHIVKIEHREGRDRSLSAPMRAPVSVVLRGLAGPSLPMLAPAPRRRVPVHRGPVCPPGGSCVSV